MKFENFKRSVGAAALAVSLGLSGAAHATTVETVEVDTVLSLVIDVSGSVNGDEFLLQRTGYVNAFNDASVISAITNTDNGRLGKIAVNVVQFSSSAVESIKMTIIDSGTTSSAFATALNGMARALNNNTGIGVGIDKAEETIRAWLTAGNTATRKVIDVSGDGQNNTGTSPLSAGESFCNAPGDTPAGLSGVINGIAIGTASLKTYYENNVACGGGFVLLADGFDSFDQAIRTKLRAEISGENPNVIPLPAGAWLLLGGLGAFAAVRRKKAA